MNCSSELCDSFKLFDIKTESEKVFQYLKESLDEQAIKEMYDCLHSIKNYLKKDGNGLTGGALTDIFISNFFQKKIKKYTEHHDGQSDFKILDIPMSLKKITGKSTIALNWSKNSNIKTETFQTDIMIINLKAGTWWKNKKDYCKFIPSGIFIIDKYFCIENILLTSNNKSNSIINSQNLYNMICHSIKKNSYIVFPEKYTALKFSFSFEEQ